MEKTQHESGRFSPSRVHPDLINSTQVVHQLATAANAKGIEVVSESESNLDPIIKEAREGFTAQVEGTKRH